jgi:hypothetical protein
VDKSSRGSACPGTVTASHSGPEGPLKRWPCWMAASLRDPVFLPGRLGGGIGRHIVRPSGVLAVCCHMRWTTLIPGRSLDHGRLRALDRPPGWRKASPGVDCGRKRKPQVKQLNALPTIGCLTVATPSIEGMRRSAKALLNAGAVGAGGVEPPSSSVSAKFREPLGGRPFSQVARDRRGRS